MSTKFTEFHNKIEDKILEYKKLDKNIFITSSFQTYSMPLLHIISLIDNSIPIYFLNTGFHFAETIEFKNRIENMFNVKIIDVASEISKVNQVDENGMFHYVNNISYCCYINKVLPMQGIFNKYDVWISGIRKDQNANRAKMSETHITKEGIERYHPILDWTSKMVWDYIDEYNLPTHPLEEKGYLTVGCEPCTSKFIDSKLDTLRDGSRWEGMNKTECGLHTDLANK